MAKRFYKLDPNDMVALSSDIPSGYGTVTVYGEGGSATSDQGVTYNQNFYSARLLGDHVGDAPNFQTIIVKAGDTVNVTYTSGASGDCSVFKNGSSQTTRPTTITMDDGDQWLICFGTCLAPDTLITMSDGSFKRVDDIHDGDLVLTPFGPDRVLEVSHGNGLHVDWWWFDGARIVKTVGRHRFYNVELGEPMYLEAWNMGEHGLLANGNPVKLVEHKRYNEVSRHCTIFTEKWNLYYANGLLAGNRRSMGYEEIKA